MRLKLRVEVRDAVAGMRLHVVNLSANCLKDLQHSVQRLGAASPLHVLTEHGLQPVTSEEHWQVLEALYLAGLQQQGPATFRLRLTAAPAEQPDVKRHSPGTPGMANSPPLSSPPQLHPGHAAGRTPTAKRTCMRQSSERRACQDQNCTPPPKQSFAYSSPRSASGSVPATPQPCISPLDGDWDQQVLSSIKQTVAKLHFGSHLSGHMKLQQPQPLTA